MCNYMGRTKRTLVVLFATSLLVELGLASSSIKVNDFKAKVLEFDGTTTKAMTMVYPERSSEVIELDHTQKLKVRVLIVCRSEGLRGVSGHGVSMRQFSKFSL